MITDAPTDARKRVVFLDHTECILITVFPDKGDVTLRPLARRAGVTTRSNPLFFNSIRIGDGLRVKLVGGPLLCHPPIKPTGNDHGTDLRALSASRTLSHVDIARFVTERDGEIAGLPFYLGHFSIGHQLNVEVTAGFDQLGTDDAHSAVVRGKRLVELGHPPADGRALFGEVYPEAGVGQV